MQNDLRRIQYRAEGRTQVVRQYVGKQIPDPLRTLRVLPDRFREHMVDCLIGPDHLLRGRRIAGQRLLPSAQHAGAQGSIFRHHVVDAVALCTTIVRVLVGDPVETGCRIVFVAARPGLLLLSGLRFAHIHRDPDQDVACGVPQLGVRKMAVPDADRAGVLRPLVDQIGKICFDKAVN